MARIERHTHPCSTPNCLTRLACHGELSGNHDGWPEVICLDFHLPNGSTVPLICGDCEQKRDDEIAAGTRCGTCLEPLAPGEACGDCLGGTEDPHDLAVPFARDH
jgi:hypothetical protein